MITKANHQQKQSKDKHGKTAALAEIIQKRGNRLFQNILVVGCGSGIEAGFLARYFHADTIGIDIGTQFAFDHEGSLPAKLKTMDAHALDFPDRSFDLVYSFHALEHMNNPQVALKEMARVLTPDGLFVIGTPNKRRLIGYLGSNTSLLNKVRWNLSDLAMRVRGKWRNEAGAHAGFTEKELLSMCRSSFRGGVSITDEYYQRLYGTRFLRMLEIFRLKKFLYPCVYLLGRYQS